MTLGDVIKLYRENNNMSMDDFAKKCSLSKGYISMLENNVNPRSNKPIAPTLPTLKKIATGMNTDVDNLLKKLDADQEISLQENKIGERIRLRREAIGLTQEELAKKLGYKNRSSITKIESGINDIAQNKVKDFALALNTTVAYLMDRQEKPPIPYGAIPYTRPTTTPIPLVGVVNCGIPLLAEDNIESYIETPTDDILTGEVFFWLRAKGDSMINVGIHEGDLLLIRQQNDVDSGSIAVVAVNGDNATLKRVIKKESAIVLQPENPAYEIQIFVGDEMKEISIMGKLMKLEKRFY